MRLPHPVVGTRVGYPSVKTCKCLPNRMAVLACVSSPSTAAAIGGLTWRDAAELGLAWRSRLTIMCL